MAYPDGAAVPWAYFVEAILAKQIEEGSISLQQAVLVFINAHLLQNPLVHQRCSLDAIPKPVLDLDLPNKHCLHASLKSIQDSWNLYQKKKNQEILLHLI